MKFKLKLLAMAMMAVGLFGAETAQAEAVVGQVAPAFSVQDVNGHTVSLADLKGKNVVLEWTNAHCPFVKKHYGTQNMQAVQKKATDVGAIWISVNSSADGKQGNFTPEEAKEILTEQGAHPTHLILDPKGEIGHLYGAQTTPHMFVIDADGKIAYAGAIDDNSSANPKSVNGAKNYVLAALDDLNHGKAVAEPQTKPYGCSVKY